MPPGVPSVIFNGAIELGSGQEWHSEPILLEKGTVVIVQARSQSKFYAGLFPREEYFRKRSPPNPFGFTWGTDKPQYTVRVSVPETDYYYLVFRVGVFTVPSPVKIGVLATTQ
jgi:hypothetical protein